MESIMNLYAYDCMSKVVRAHFLKIWRRTLELLGQLINEGRVGDGVNS